MGNLELKAKEYFEKRAMEDYGRLLSWFRVPPKRQLEWMEDIFGFYKETIDNMLALLEEKQYSIVHSTSFELGYREGEKHERQKLRRQYEVMLEALYTELEDKREDCADNQQ